MANLRARLYQNKIDEQMSSTRSSRKLQVGSSARSEKIRTYNFPQDRITDHRINFTLHNSMEFLRGGQPLENLLYQLKDESRREKLVEFLENQKV
jgi:peptide chain release factor 1